jgi:hypothetical protein
MTCELHQDTDPVPPSDWDQLGELVAFPSLWRDYRFAARETTGTEDDALDRGGFALVSRYLKMAEGLVTVPFHFQDYGSSGARMTIAATYYENGAVMFDDDPDGFIWTDAKRCAELGVDIANAEKQLCGELQEWAAWVAGEVVGFVVTDAHGETVESVWGFYPDKSTSGDPLGLEHVRAEARAAAEWEANERTHKARLYGFGNVADWLAAS